MKQLTLIALVLLNIAAATAQNEMQLLGSKFYPDGLSSLWGYTDADDGHEYALVGVKSGTSIVDITDPTNPTELFFVVDDFNIWREIKTWQQYAYTVDEVDGGVTIIDLSQLPTAIDTVHFWADGRVRRAHSLWIDENGFLYLNGFNNINLDVPVNERGVMIFDLNADPMHPTYVNTYTANYAHDTFVRDNIMYISEIYAGQLSIVDIADKQNPIWLASQTTPNTFTHNAWLSDDSQTIFTTDERNGATMAAYDISDLSDIKELDRYQAYPSTNTMPHNAHVLNDFVVISYYTAGFRVVDAHVPDALIETEYYDTSPDTGGGSSGCWGVYQYLLSGNLIASDRQQGLFIVRPQFQRASYLQGTITNAITENGIAGVRMSIVGTTAFDHSQFGGTYKTGTANSGVYSVVFEKYGYETLTVTGVELNEAQFTDLNVQMQPLLPFAMQVNVTDPNGTPLPNVKVEIRNSWASNSEGIYNGISNDVGVATFDGLYNDTYTISASKWGLLPAFPFVAIANNTDHNVAINMQHGYYDDFATDLGWTVESTDTMTGKWVLVAPTGTQGGTPCTIYNDIDDDWSNQCYTTGNGYALPEDVDIDNGMTRLTSPTLNLSNYTTASLRFSLFYCVTTDADPTQSAINIYNGANGELLFSTILADTLQNGTNVWQSFVIPINQLISETPNTHFVVEARANGSNGVVEAAFDRFEIIGDMAVGILPTTTADSETIQAIPTLFDTYTAIRCPNQPTQIVCVFDLTGRVIAQKTLQRNDVWYWGHDVPQGLYLVQASGQAIRVVKR